MNKILKKATVVLTMVLMVSAMAVSASAVSKTEASCSGGAVQSKLYYVSPNPNTNVCASNIDVNALLEKFCANNSTVPSGGAVSFDAVNTVDDSSKGVLAQPSEASDESDTVNCNGGICVAGDCATGTCLNGDCAKNNCAVSDGCTASDCTKVSKQSTIVYPDSANPCTGDSSLVERINNALARCGLNINKLSANLSENSGSTITAVPIPTSVTNTQTVPTTDIAASTDGENIDNKSFETRVASLVNEQRAANGLAPLTLSTELSNVARTKSQDMHDNNYFSHTSPTYGSPFDMMNAFGISYRTAGENIAMGYDTPEAVVSAWMNSAGHRANILNGSYTQLGVGYVADGSYWTQEFIG